MFRPDAELAWSTWGDAGDPVLLLHGALSTAEQNYRMVLKPLSAQFRLFGLDFRGHGGSSNPTRRFTLEVLRDDVLALLDQWELERVHVLGTSLGGYVALALQALVPSRVASLGLAGVRPGWTSSMAEERVNFFQPEAILAEYPHWKDYLADLHGRHHGPNHWRTLATQVGGLLAHLPTEPAVSWDSLTPVSGEKPLFYVVGDRDALVPLDTVVKVRERRPDAHILVVPRAGHLFREYEPAVFSSAYAAFLRRYRI